MTIKEQLEEKNILLSMQRIEAKTDQYDAEVEDIHQQMAVLDKRISLLLQKQHAFYNEKWDRVFRVGAEASYFAYQVERYACIYMEKLADLLEHSPFYVFSS